MIAAAMSGVLVDSPPEGAVSEGAVPEGAVAVAVATGTAAGAAVVGAVTAVGTGVAVAEDPQATARISAMTTETRIADFFRAMNIKFIVSKPPNG